VDAQTLILFVVRATALLLAGAAVAALLRRSQAGARHLVWLVTLAGLLALPLSLRLTPLRLPILPPALAPASPALGRAVQAPRAPRIEVERVAAPRAAAAPPPAAAPVATRSLADVLPPALLGIWLAVALTLLAWQAAGALAARRLVRSAGELDDERWRGPLFEVSDRLDVAEPPRLVVSDRVRVPFAFGLLRPAIVLPAAAEDWSDERLRLVLVHEIAHVSRRDLVAHALARVACALYWFHPLVWVAARKLRAESERACDDFVLACGARASDYAGLLLDVVATVRHSLTPATAMPMGRRRELEGRVLAILDPALRRGAPGRLQATALLGGLAAVFVAVAATAPAARALPYAQTTNSAEPYPLAEPVEGAASESPEEAQSAPRAEEARSEARAEAAAEAHAARASRDGDEEAPARVSPQNRAMLARVLREDTDASVRRSAAWALGQNPRGEDAAALAGVLRADTDAEVREMAAWALGENEGRGADATAALTEALKKDASEEVRAIAAWALGQSSHADTAGLLAAVADGSPEVRETAIWALGNQDLDKAPAPLIAALKDADESVRLVAAWALGEIGDPASEPALRAAFAAEKDPEVRRALFRALAFMREPSPQFIDEALASSDPELRRRAVMMAAGHGPGIWPWPWPRPMPRPMP
jgi:beta-lactamase regulating signal transducer with metallopeptidase domain/HEAT repeat protein